MSFREAINTVREYAAVWGVRIATILLIVFMVVSPLVPHLGILQEKEAALLGIGLVFILLLSEQFQVLFEKAQESERTLTQKQDTLSQNIVALHTRLAEQAEALASLRDSSSIRLFTLSDCLDDLTSRLELAQEIEVEHLGLDMELALDPICNFLNSHQAREVVYRLLIITDNPDEISDTNSEVKGMSHRVRTHMKTRIHNEFNQIIDRYKENGRIFKIELQHYSDIPVVHGVQVIAPVKICYLAFFRYTGLTFTGYDWGVSKYYRVIGEPSDAIQKDLLAIFHSHFRHFWGASARTKWIGDR